MFEIPTDCVNVASIGNPKGYVFNFDKDAWVGYNPLEALKYYEHLPVATRYCLKQLKERYERSSQIRTVPNIFTCGDLELKPFQTSGVEIALENPVVLLCDEAGLGKTAQAIAMVTNNFSQRVLVICRAANKQMWEVYMRRWFLPYARMQAIYSGKEPPDRSANVVILNYELFRRSEMYSRLTHFDSVIFDEFHDLQNPLSQQGQAFRKQFPKMLKDYNLPASQIFISATPMGKCPIHLANVLSVAAPQTIFPFNNYVEFGKYFCAGYKDKYDEWRMRGASNIPELNFRLRSTIMIRRKKTTAGIVLPEKLPTVMIPLNPTDEGEIRALESEVLGEKSFETRSLASFGVVMTHAAGITDGSPSRDAMMGSLARLRAAAARQKVDSALNFIIEFMKQNPNDKAVIFLYHKEVADRAIKRLAKLKPLVITGDTPTNKRFTIEQAFQTQPEHRVLIGNIRAAGVGVTLTAAKHSFFIEVPLTPAELEQAEDRIHRIGQTQDTQSYMFVLKGSLEEYITRQTVKAQKVLNNILDKNILDNVAIT